MHDRWESKYYALGEAVRYFTGHGATIQIPADGHDMVRMAKIFEDYLKEEEEEEEEEEEKEIEDAPELGLE